MGAQDVAESIAVRPDGKIVVAGYSRASDSSSDFAIARLNPNGTLDTTFSDDGKHTTDLGGVDAAHGLALQPDGKAVAVGESSGNFAVARYLDSPPPPPPPLDTTITSGPADGSTIETPTATFEFIASVTGATFECSIDGSPFTACTTPFTTPLLADGPHTFMVRAVSGAMVDTTPAQRTFTVDREAEPETLMTSGPADGSLTKANVKFKFSSPTTGATFECSLDGVDWMPCTSPLKLKRLLGGLHTFAVRAVFEGGPDPSPERRSFTVKSKR